ncbi:MAG: hypothetical protein ACYTGZ_04610 [Planctomycetota bacterium]
MIRLWSATLFLLLANTWSLAQDFADSLPEKTLAYLSIDNASRTRERIKGSAFHAMWNDPAIAGLRARFEADIKKKSDGKVDPSEFMDLLQGQLCVAAIPVSVTKMEMVVLVDLKGKRDEILDLIKRLNQQQEGETRETEDDFHGYTVTTYEHLAEGEEEPTVSYSFLKDDWMGYCENLDVLKDIITRKEAAEKTGLSTSESFKKVVAASGERVDLRWFVSSAAWLREFGMMAAPVMAALGLEQLKGVGGQISLREGGVSAQIVLQNEGEPRGIIKVLGGNVENLGPPSMLPPEADPAFIIALDWQLVYREALRVLGMFDPGSRQQIEAAIAEGEKELGLRIYDDLLGALAPGLSYALLPIPAGEAAEAPKGAAYAKFMAQYVVAFQRLRNKETIKNFLAKVTKDEGSPFKEVEYLGTTLYEGQVEGIPSLAVVDDQLVLAMRPDSLRALIQRQGKEIKGLRDAAGYKRGMSLVPAKRSLFALSNPQGATGASMMWSGFLQGAAGAAPPDVAELLPTVEFFEKYQGVSAWAISSEEQGLMLSWFWGLKKPDADAGEGEESEGAEGDE